MGSLNIILGAADFSAVSIGTGVPYIPSEVDADKILQEFSSVSDVKKSAFRLFIYRLKEIGAFSKIKLMLLPFLSSTPTEARRDYSNLDSYVDAITEGSIGSNYGYIFDEVDKTIRSGLYGGMLNNNVYANLINKNNTTAMNCCIITCSKNSTSEESVEYATLRPVQYTYLKSESISFYHNGNNNVLTSKTPISSLKDKPLIGCWSYNDAAMYYMGGDGVLLEKALNKEYMGNYKSTVPENFGSCPRFQPLSIYIVTEALTKEQIKKVYAAMEGLRSMF